ncbi:hypothetical protein ADK67_44055 [Saccharothrix sp. NRRL B-16348]|nr:hypothetical protein ADK67_44055 [Saccharothrix sp. NRRL B-16348]
MHAPLSIDEAHARHGETTPAGISHHRGDLNLGDLPHRVPADPRYFTADVHVTPDGRARIGDHTYTPEQYGDLLRRNGWDGKTPIRLIGCDAASNNFADRLSRHTGADILAPTKPAWTDANGRVYTSDAEIGPDGSRQPKIPPNGEWHTHSPDGTTTRVGDDGYVPATRDADKTDHTTPDGARDRTADKEGTGIPDNLKKQIREERLKKLKYVNETYYLYENKVKLPRYELRIKPSANVIAASRVDMLPPDEVDLKAPDDWSPPKDRVLTEDDLKCVEITLRHDRDAPLAPRYHKGIVLDSRGLSSPERVEGEQALIDERRRAIQEERAAAPESPEYREAHTRTSKHGEELGERGMQHFMSDLYPGATRLDTQLGRQNRYDGVYGLDERRFMARPSEHQRRMIVEAKGPYANKPGVAKALDGKPVKQGHDGYFDRTNHIMQRSDFSEKEIAELRDRLTAEERVPLDQLDRRIAEVKAQEQQMATDLDRLVRYPEEIKARYMQDFLGIDDIHVDAHLHRAESATAGITDHERAAHRLDGGYDRYYDDLINHYKHHGALPADVNAALHRAFAERNESLPDGFVERMMARLEHVRDYGMVEYSRVQAKVREVPLTDYLARYDPDAAGTLDRLPQGQRDDWVREYLAKKGYSAPDLANPGIEVYDGYVAKAYQMRWQRTS